MINHIVMSFSVFCPTLVCCSTLISGMVILVSGFLSSIRKIRVCSSSLILGLQKNTKQSKKGSCIIICTHKRRTSMNTNIVHIFLVSLVHFQYLMIQSLRMHQMSKRKAHPSLIKNAGTFHQTALLALENKHPVTSYPRGKSLTRTLIYFVSALN